MSPTLGQRLQQAREHRGLSLPDVAHQTRIPVQRLRELEEDNYNALGSITYAKGHLRAYAEMLGVEADEVLEHLKAPPLGGVRNYRYLVESYGPLKPVSQSEHPMQELKSVASGKSSLVTAMVTSFCVLLVGGVLLGNAFLGQQQPEPTPATGAVVTNPIPVHPEAGNETQGESALAGASPNVEPAEEVRAATPSEVTPPKALPVTDEPPSKRQKLSKVPKAQLVE